MPDDNSDVQPVWEYTTRAARQANESPYGSRGGGPYGSYMNRHIIGRNSRILGGVSMVAGHPILIVVSEDDGVLPSAYTELTERIARHNVRDVRLLLRTIHDFVREKLVYTAKLNDAMRRRFAPSGRQVKLPLALYVSEGTGVCWQQGLLAAYLVEKLIDEGYVRGSVSTDRNMKRDVYSEWKAFANNEMVGHQWARYTAADGTVYIVDPAQDYCGPLAEVPLDARGLWRDYFRPEDPKPAKAPAASRWPEYLDELDFLVAVAIVAAATWMLVT